MSITFNQLADIGIHAPAGATSFHTKEGKIVYLIGETGNFVERPIDDDAFERLKTLYGMGGTFGWEIQGAGKVSAGASATAEQAANLGDRNDH